AACRPGETRGRLRHDTSSSRQRHMKGCVERARGILLGAALLCALCLWPPPAAIRAVDDLLASTLVATPRFPGSRGSRDGTLNRQVRNASRWARDGKRGGRREGAFPSSSWWALSGPRPRGCTSACCLTWSSRRVSRRPWSSTATSV